MILRRILFLGLLILGCESSQPLLGDVHYHADFKVYIHGQVLDFAQDRFMSTEEHALSNFTHLHDGDGEMIHKHMSGITLGDFFKSLGMEFTEDCLALDTGKRYCSEAENTLKMWVNGKANEEFGYYEFKDLDQILISYGNETEAELNIQRASVGDRACIYSELCPERGEPPEESSCLSSADCVAEP